MLNRINIPISVIAIYDAIKKTTLPYKIHWNNREYKIKNLAYYHQVKKGANVYHIYHVSDGNLDFRLSLDSSNLNWTLEEVSDGLAN